MAKGKARKANAGQKDKLKSLGLGILEISTQGELIWEAYLKTKGETFIDGFVKNSKRNSYLINGRFSGELEVSGQKLISKGFFDVFYLSFAEGGNKIKIISLGDEGQEGMAKSACVDNCLTVFSPGAVAKKRNSSDSLLSLPKKAAGDHTLTQYHFYSLKSGAEGGTKGKKSKRSKNSGGSEVMEKDRLGANSVPISKKLMQIDKDNFEIADLIKNDNGSYSVLVNYWGSTPFDQKNYSANKKFAVLEAKVE